MKAKINSSTQDWKIIPDYNDYLINNQGEIKSLKHNKVITLKPSISGGKYQVRLTKNGIQKSFKLATLVAKTFLNYNSNSNLVILHKDKNQLNNSVGNLEIVSFRETCQNKINSQSKYPTVQRNVGGFSSSFRLQGKRITLSNFSTEEDAFNAYKSMTKTI